MTEKPYLRIVSHYVDCLNEHGDSHRGVDWPVAEHVPVRHGVMLDVIRPDASGRRPRLLDLGCGTAALYETILERGLDIDYSGLDIATEFVEVCRHKFPGVTFHCVDVLDDDVALPSFDYVVMNGVFTEKRDLGFDAMLEYLRDMLVRVFALAEVGMAFNVMSAHIDRQRDDLFHVPFDTLARVLTHELGRNFVFRNDYGLYEYTAYVYR